MEFDLSILERAIKLKPKIQVYSDDNQDELGEDFLTREDWDTLREIVAIFEAILVNNTVVARPRNSRASRSYLGSSTSS